MALTTVLLTVLVVELVAFAIAIPTLVGRNRLRVGWGFYRERLYECGIPIGALAVVLLVNKFARQIGPEVSWILGWNVTGTIHAIEGNFVALVQSVASPTLTVYFSGIYIYGYVFLLVFPLVAYFFHNQSVTLRRLVVAYSVNYVLGLLCYLLFVSYGPRNLLPDLVQPLLYTNYPSSQLLVTKVNTNTNVFPSLHTSLSVTVALFAYRTREEYPAWLWVAGVLAASVVISTMYLGIHWAIDVVAGTVVAVVSLIVADHVVNPPSNPDQT